MFNGVKNKIEQVQEIYDPLKVSINLLIVNHAFFIYYERFTAAAWAVTRLRAKSRARFHLVQNIL